MTEKDELKAYLYANPLMFALHCFPNHFTLEPAKFHKEMLELAANKSNKKLCFAAPRGSAKSTILSLAYVIYCIVYCEAEFIVIVSDSQEQSKLFLHAIKMEFVDNDILRDLYGDLVGKSKWGEEEIETKTQIRIMARGAEQQIRGLKYRNNRINLLLIDDLENEELVASPERRSKLWRWFLASATPALSRDGRVIMVGTIIHYDSVLAKVLRDKTFTRRIWRAKNDDGTMLWADNMNEAQWEAKKEEYRANGEIDLFFSEYQNDPVAVEGAVFSKDDFRYFEPSEELASHCTRFLLVDPAISEDRKADFSVCMAVYVDCLGNAYVWDYIAERVNPLVLLENIFALATKHNVDTVGIEGVAFQKFLQNIFEEEMFKRNQVFVVKELKADKDKLRRIKSLQPRYKQHTIFHRGWMTDLEYQLLQVTENAIRTKYKDIMDALAYFPQISFLPAKPESPDNTPKQWYEEIYESENPNRAKHHFTNPRYW